MGFTSNVTGVTTYTYVASGITGGLTGASSGTGPSISQVLNCPGPGLCSVNYVITPFANGCQGESVGRTIYIVPPSETIASDRTICSEEAFVLSTTATFGTPYFWFKVDYSDNISGKYTEGATYSAHNSADPIGKYEKIKNTSTTLGYAVYTITPYFSFQPYGGCDGTPRNVIVTVKPAPTVNQLEDVNVCSEEIFTRVLSANLPGPATFSWDFYHPDSGYPASSSGNPLSRSISNTTNAAQTSRFHIKATVDGCQGAERILYARIKPKPILTTFWAGRPPGSSVSSADRNFGSGTPDNIPLTANVSGTTFTWPTPSMRFGTTGGTAGSGNTISQTLYYSGSGLGDAQYTVTPTAEGCVGTPATCFVAVWPATPSSITASGATTFCTGGSVVLTAAHLSGNTYVWKRNGTTIAGATSTTLTVTQPGDYWVITSNSAYSYGYSGKSNIITVSVSGNDPSISIIPEATLSACQVLSATLIASQGSSYVWYKDDQLYSYSKSLPLPGPGKYYVKVTNPVGCQSGTLTSNSVIIESPFQVSIFGSTTGCAGQSIELTTSVSRSNGRAQVLPDYYYSWSTGEYSPSIFAPGPGTYSLTVTDPRTGCSVTVVHIISTAANCPTPPRDPCGTTARCLETKAEFNELSITSFPNPADRELTIRFNKPITSDAKVSLMHITGAMVIHTKVNAGDTELSLPLDNLVQGPYVLQVRVEGGIKTQKILVMHSSTGK